MPQSINPAQLAERLRDKRAAYSLSIRQAAEAAGMSASTFSRVVNSHHLPDYEHLLLLAAWAGVTLDQLTVDGNTPEGTKKPSHMVVHAPQETTLESIALHLRADDNLEPEDVDLLMDVVRVAYGKLCKRHTRYAK